MRKVHNSAELLVYLIIYVSGVTAVRKREMADSNPASEPVLNVFLDTRWHVFSFNNQIQAFFDKKPGFFG